MPLTSDQILVHDAATGISFHAQEKMTKLVLDTIKAQEVGADKFLAAALESLVEHILRKLLSSP